jgi:hypothetical protein
MPSTEQLISIRSLTGEAKSKANREVDQYAEHRYKHKYQTRIRMNRINALANCNFGNSLTFEVPSHGQICGEMALSLNLPALADGATYKPYAAMRIIDKIVYRAGGTQFYEIRPAEVVPLLINRARDKDHKDRLKAIWGNAAAANAQEILIPLLTPWSVWNNASMMETLDFGVRGQCIWDGSRLAKNLVVEVQFASKAQATSSASSAFTTASSLGSAQLFWEELVGNKATIDAIRARIPTTFYGEEYTRLKNVSINGDGTALTPVNVSALTARAGTKGFYFICRTQTEAATDDPWVGDERLREIRVELDGREVASNEGEPASVQEYQELLAGRKTLPAPNFAAFTFGNDQSAAFHAQTYSGLLKNQAVNECLLRLGSVIRNPAAPMECDVIAVHPRQYTFSSGTVRASNCY